MTVTPAYRQKTQSATPTDTHSAFLIVKVSIYVFDYLIVDIDTVSNSVRYTACIFDTDMVSIPDRDKVSIISD